jgi:hypothetical protein
MIYKVGGKLGGEKRRMSVSVEELDSLATAATIQKALVPNRNVKIPVL